MKPLSPKEVIENKQFDSRIIEVVNSFLIKRYVKGSSCTIKLKEIENELRSKYEDININELYENKQFDFEDEFRKVGWAVVYDNPGWNETYDSFFRFSKK